MVLILPAVQEIMRLYPNARLHFVTSPDGQRLLKSLALPVANMVVYRNRILYRPTDVAAIKQFIKKNTFDLIYCFETKKRTVSWLPSSAHILQETQVLTHYATRCLELVNSALEYTHQEHYLIPNQNTNPELDSWLASYGITPQTIVIGFHPTYSGFNKWNKKKEGIHRLWPWERFAALAKAISEYAKEQGLDVKIIMDLLPEEQFLGQKIQEQSDSQAILLDSKPNFRRYLNLLQRLNLLIAPNTGVMHLAAGLNTPQVALFSQLDPRDCGPYMPSSRFKVLEAKDCSEAQLGLAAIPMHRVFEEVILLLKQQVNSKGHRVF